jgi:hypothetical protein
VAARDLILKRDAESDGQRYRVIHQPTGRMIGQIAMNGGSVSKSWHWSLQHPFEEGRVGPHSGRTDELEDAQAALARHWRQAPLPEGMLEHGGFVFKAFKPPKDIPWTIKITRRDAQAFQVPGCAQPQLLAWVRFDHAKSADDTVAMTKAAIDKGSIAIPPAEPSTLPSDS